MLLLCGVYYRGLDENLRGEGWEHNFPVLLFPSWSTEGGSRG